MKTLFLILILTLGWLVSNAQLHKPVQPLNENGYTLVQFETFALSPTEYSASYRERLLSLVNHFLAETGLYKKYNNGNPLDESWISWIFYPGRTSTEWRVYPNGFRNTYQSYDGRSVEWFWDKRRFEGLVTTLHLEGYELDLGKTVCTNLVDVPFKTVMVIPPQIDSNPATIISTSKQEDWSFLAPKKMYEDKITVSPIFLDSEKTKTKTWFGRHWGWIAGTLGATALTTGGIYLYNNRGHHVATTIEPRTMPPGIPSIPATPTPGLPSDPRTMPGGIGLNFSFSF